MPPLFRLSAAMPVVAVSWTTLPMASSASMMWLMTSVLPTPAEPGQRGWRPCVDLSAVYMRPARSATASVPRLAAIEAPLPPPSRPHYLCQRTHR